MLKNPLHYNPQNHRNTTRPLAAPRPKAEYGSASRQMIVSSAAPRPGVPRSHGSCALEWFPWRRYSVTTITEQKGNMATITRKIPITTGVEQAWETIADPARVNELLTFLGPVTVAGNQRSCSLGDQGTLEELLVSTDTDQRRIAYSIVSSPFGFVHHHASMQVIHDPSGATFVWTTDFLPDELRPAIEPVIDLGVWSIEQVLGVRELA